MSGASRRTKSPKSPRSPKTKDRKKKPRKFRLGTPKASEKPAGQYPAQNVIIERADDDQERLVRMASEIQDRKNELKEQVLHKLNQAGLMNSSKTLSFLGRFFDELGIDDGYFRLMNSDLIAAHIHSIYAYKILKHAKQSGEHIDGLYLKQEYGDNLALYSVRSNPSAEKEYCVSVEREIETKYLLEGYTQDPIYETLEPSFVTRPWRLECHSTANPVEDEKDDFNFPLRFYLLRKPVYASEIEDDEKKAYVAQTPLSTGGMNENGDVEWLETVTAKTRELYWDCAMEVGRTIYPVVRIVNRAETPHEKKLVIAYRHGTTHSLLSSLTELYHGIGLTATKKFIEQFKNGVVLMCVWLQPLSYVESGGTNLDTNAFEEAIENLLNDLGTLFAMPRHKISMMFEEKQNPLTIQEASFLSCAWQFAHQFLNQYGDEYQTLLSSISSRDPDVLPSLYKLKTNLREDTFHPDRVISAFEHHAEFGKRLYREFCDRHDPHKAQPMTELPDFTDLLDLAKKSANTTIDYEILAACVNFLKHIVRTNFFKKEKLAISFRLNPRFIDEREYPLQPYGVYFIVGSFFRGFHVRFSDIARGGIRLILSRNRQAYEHNIGSVFTENYNLASTQFRKNKDIPEGGSKGTIILDYGLPREAGAINFRKYIDAILDLLVLSDEIVDHLNGKSEILFMGPDEGTADLMGWACRRARERGYPYWKAFSTGKPPSMGGIPHDIEGMTTRGIHQYVLGILDKLGLDERELTKCQTGGPDGDLGGNEIKISLDKTVVVIDGSGTLYDPDGIDKEELLKLAHAGKMIEYFDTSKLSPNGFRVLCDEPGVNEDPITLPHGEQVESGLMFRNMFHTHPLFKADFFVPCGGRPKAIHLGNVKSMFDEDGTPHFRFIVEGANLFFTDEARIYLEERNVIVFKDASANKGGVTSSSLEVLAALAMTDEQHAEHMCVIDDQNPPQFYRDYVQEVIATIEKNCQNEFHCIWNEHERSGIHRTKLTDVLSNRVNELNVQLVEGRLWNRKKLRKFVILDAVPKCLIDLIGEAQLFERVPEAYLKAIFGAHFASMFVYERGLNTSPFSFTDFLEEINEKLGAVVE